MYTLIEMIMIKGEMSMGIC